MTVAELKSLFRWCDTEADNTTFWSRLWWAAQSYDMRMCALLRGLVAAYGTIPQLNSAQKLEMAQ